MLLNSKKSIIIASILYVTTSLTTMAYASSDPESKKAAATPVYVDISDDEICSLISNGMRTRLIHKPEQISSYRLPTTSSDKTKALLFDAVLYQNDVMFLYFLQQGFHPCVFDESGKSLLVKAIESHNFQLARHFVNGDYLTPEYINHQDPEHETALHTASKMGKADIIKSLIEKGANRQLKETEVCTSPLLYAADGGYADCVEALLADLKGDDLLNYVNCKTSRFGHITPLLSASGNGKADVVRLLIAKGADRNLPSSNCNTALVNASKAGQLECIDALLEGLTGPKLTKVLNYENPIDKSTALMIAIKTKQEKVAAKLLDYGACVPDGVSEIILAAEMGATIRLENIIKKAKNKRKLFEETLTIDRDDKRERTRALDWACFKGRIACIKILLDNKAPHTTNSTGQNQSFLWALDSKKPVLTILALFKGLEAQEDRRALEICLKYKEVNPEVKTPLETILAAKAPKAPESTRGRATERRGADQKQKPKSKKGSEAGAKAGAGGPTVPTKPNRLGDELGGGAWGGARPDPTPVPAPKPADDGPKTVDTDGYLREMEELQAQPILETLTATQKETLVDKYNASKDTDKGSFHGWIINMNNTGRLERILNPRERSVSVKPSYRERSVSVLGRRGVSKPPMASGGASASAMDTGPGFRLTESGPAITAYRDELAETGTTILNNFNQALTTLETQGLSGFGGRLKKIESADNNEYEVRLNDGTRLFFKDNGDGSFTIIKRRRNHL